MMIILASYTINMQRDPRILRKALHAMRDHLTAQIADLLTLETEFDDCVGTVGEVDDGAGEGFVQRGICGSEACEAGWGAEGVFECAAKGETDVFCGVVVVDLKVKLSV